MLALNESIIGYKRTLKSKGFEMIFQAFGEVAASPKSLPDLGNR